MQRFKVHSHSQAVFPYSQESTIGSLQYHTTQPNIGKKNYTCLWCGIIPFIGGESVLIGSIFDVFSCQLLQKSVKSDYFGVIFYNLWRKVRKIEIFTNQNADFTTNLHEDPEYSGFLP